MAIVRKPTAKVTYILQDQTGSIGSMEINAPADAEEALVESSAGSLRALLQNVSDCAILGYSITKSFVETTPETPASGSRIERKGVFQFVTEAGKITKTSVPGIDNLLVNPDGTIDINNGAVSLFIDAFTDALSLWRDSNNVELTALSAAYERFNSSTKGQLPNRRLEA